MLPGSGNIISNKINIFCHSGAYVIILNSIFKYTSPQCYCDCNSLDSVLWDTNDLGLRSTPRPMFSVLFQPLFFLNIFVFRTFPLEHIFLIKLLFLEKKNGG